MIQPINPGEAVIYYACKCGKSKGMTFITQNKPVQFAGDTNCKCAPWKFKWSAATVDKSQEPEMHYRIAALEQVVQDLTQWIIVHKLRDSKWPN